MSKYIPVGIYNNELFMTEDPNHVDCIGHMIFDVIRPVSVSDLERYQSDDYIYDDCEELWREKVAHDKNYTGGLDEFVEEVKQQYCCEGEEYPFKDDSFCGVLENEDAIYKPLEEWKDYYFEDCDLTDEIEDGNLLSLRKFVDAYIECNTGEAVGTWEAAGCYSPYEDMKERKYSKFDCVLNEELAHKWYKQAGLE